MFLSCTNIGHWTGYFFRAVPNRKQLVNHGGLERRLISYEAAGHPIRQMLARAEARPKRNDDQDLKLFVLSFTAFFICFYTLIM